MREFFFAVLLLLPACPVKAQQNLSFASEYIDFALDESFFSVNGIYRFSNNNDKTAGMNLLFPFPVSTSFIDTMSVINLGNFQKMAYKKREQDIIFSLSLLPGDSADIHIFYRQPVSRVNSYILSTTQSWGSPLKKAAYTLTTDKDQSIISFSIEPDSSVTGSENRIYYWNKVDFNPQTDFEIVIDR